MNEATAQPEPGDEICGSMTELATDFPSLMSFWRRHRDETRPVGQIVSEARGGTLPGVRALKSGFGFEVIDAAAALKAMRRRPT